MSIGVIGAITLSTLYVAYTTETLNKEIEKLKSKSSGQTIMIQKLTDANDKLYAQKSDLEKERNNESSKRKDLNNKLYESNEENKRLKLEIEKAKREKKASVSSRGSGSSAVPSAQNKSVANSSNVKTSESGKPINTPQGNWITMNASAYTNSPSENGGYTTTAIGDPLVFGMVAVDPNFLPLGTRIKIDGFGETIFKCSDTGGAIKGNRIDILLGSKSEAMKFGRRSVKVQVVK